jgi:hypothetical protein
MVTSVHSNVVDCIVEYNNEITGVIKMAAKVCLHKELKIYFLSKSKLSNLDKVCFTSRALKLGVSFWNQTVLLRNLFQLSVYLNCYQAFRTFVLVELLRPASYQQN